MNTIPYVEKQSSPASSGLFYSMLVPPWSPDCRANNVVFSTLLLALKVVWEEFSIWLRFICVLHNSAFCSINTPVHEKRPGMMIMMPFISLFDLRKTQNYKEKENRDFVVNN